MSSTGDAFDERVTARLSQLAGAETLAQACEIVVHELHEWTLGADGWAPAVPEVPVHRVYEIAVSLSTTEAERQSLQLEALFISRSASVKAATLAEEARKRSEAGKRGGAPKAVSDEQLRTIVAEWDRSHPETRHGLIKFVAGRSGLSAERAGGRLKKLQI